MANKVLMSLTVPVNVTLAVPLVPKVTPVPANTVSVPLATDKVTVSLLLPASTSAICKPLMTLAVSSVVVCAPGTVLVGALLTGVTVMVDVNAVELAVPSLMI